MKKFALLFVFLLLVSFIFVDCKRGGDSPIPGIGKKIGKKLEFDNTDDLLVTENEVKSFVKAHPVFMETAKKEGEKLEGLAGKNVLKAMKGGRQAIKSVNKINKALEPYGFTIETYMKTYGKIFGTYAYMMGLEAKKLAKGNIKSMKAMLDNPNIPEEQKEDIRESIKELEKEDDSEEAKAYEKNIKIIDKYKDDLDNLLK